MVGARKAQGVVLSVVMASGCGSDGFSQDELQAADTVEATGYATVEGVVELSDGVVASTDLEVPTTLNQPPPPRECGASDEGVSWHDDALVGVGGFPIEAAKNPQGRTHELSIEKCRLSERVLPVAIGDQIRLTNRGSYPFMPVLGVSDPSKVLLRGESQSFRIGEGGMHEIYCSFTAACGKTRVAAFHHDIHTQLGKDGKFRLTQVPAGVAVQVSAWHPTLGSNVQTVTLKPGETRQLKFLMKPGEGEALLVASSATEKPAQALAN